MLKSVSRRPYPKVPHRGHDVVSIRVDGKHVDYACYHHAPHLVAWLEQGNESVGVSQWGVRTQKIGLRNREVVIEPHSCCFKDVG